MVRRLALFAAEHESSNPVALPERHLHGSGAVVLVPGDDHESLLADDRQPLVVLGAPRNFGQLPVPGVDDAAYAFVEFLAEPEIVLIDEELGRSWHGYRLRRQRRRCLLVGDGGTDVFHRHVVQLGDLLDRLTGVM